MVRGLVPGDEGNYLCVATSAGVFNAETVTDIKVNIAEVLFADIKGFAYPL